MLLREIFLRLSPRGTRNLSVKPLLSSAARVVSDFSFGKVYRREMSMLVSDEEREISG